LDRETFKQSSRGDAQGLRPGSPELGQAFERGGFVSLTVKSGSDVSGYVCDRDAAGILLDVRDPSGDPGGYEFLPWSSVERVKILVIWDTSA
jgi:hypothetical protein